MLDLSKCDFIAPSIKSMPSFVAALKEGCPLNALSGGMLSDEISKIENDPLLFLNDFIDPPKMIALPDGREIERVPDTTFWFCNGSEYLGTVNIRHYLNDNLKKFGGHIGYLVRPKYRGQGVATEMLRRALIFCRENLKLEQALVDCHADNVASARVMEKKRRRFV